MDNHTLLIIFVGLTGAAVVLQACVLFAIFLSLKKAAQAVMQTTEDVKATVIPMAHSTRQLVERITPQVITISAGLAELSEALRTETKGVRVSVSEIMERVSRQTARLDSMLTHGLDTVEKAGTVIETAVALPVRQANGIVAAVKAIIETYRKPAPRRAPQRPDPIDPEI